MSLRAAEIIPAAAGAPQLCTPWPAREQGVYPDFGCPPDMKNIKMAL